jgi:hypothetical protein
MKPDQIIEALEKEGNMTNVMQMDKNVYQGQRNGMTITVTIRKNPRLGYWVEAQGGGRKAMGNHDHLLGVAISIVHWHDLS